MDVKTIYQHVPAWGQDLLVSAYGLKLRRTRYGHVYRHEVERLQQRDYSNAKEQKSFQNEEFLRLFNFAKKHSVFYRELYGDKSVKDIGQIEELPVVTKEMLRSAGTSINTVAEQNAVTAFTGGTTGKSLRVLYTKEDFQRRMAYLDVFKMRCGVDPHRMKKATFSGREILAASQGRSYWRNNYAYRQRLYSTFHLSEDTLPLYLSNLRAFRPEIVNGFVSAIYEVAHYILRSGDSLESPPKAIFTTSETLMPHHREVIEEAFRSRIFNQYASAEGAPFITECAFGRMHYNLDTGVIEVDSDDQMLVTSFTTYGTPLIRYAIGDKATFSAEECPCGSCHPVIDGLNGRAVDYLVAHNGQKVSLSHLADVIKGLSGPVVSMQFIQEASSEIRVLLVPDPNQYNEMVEAQLLQSLRYRFGGDMAISVTKVDRISREPSGKYALIRRRADVVAK